MRNLVTVSDICIRCWKLASCFENSGTKIYQMYLRAGGVVCQQIFEGESDTRCDTFVSDLVVIASCLCTRQHGVLLVREED